MLLRTGSTEQLNWMYAACAGPAALRFVDVRQPEQIFPGAGDGRFSGVLEFISHGRVNYSSSTAGSSPGISCDRPAGGSVVRYIESLFELRADGTPPAIAGSIVSELGDIPAQAPGSQVRAYRDLFRRISQAVAEEFPPKAKRKKSGPASPSRRIFPVFMVLGVSAHEDEPRPRRRRSADREFRRLDSGSWATSKWSLPAAPSGWCVNPTRDQRFVLQAAGYYDKLPWRIPGRTDEEDGGVRLWLAACRPAVLPSDDDGRHALRRCHAPGQPWRPHLARRRAAQGRCPLVVAEDTRRTRQLLTHLDSHPRLLSFHAHSDAERLRRYLSPADRGRRRRAGLRCRNAGHQRSRRGSGRPGPAAGIPVVPIPGRPRSPPRSPPPAFPETAISFSGSTRGRERSAPAGWNEPCPRPIDRGLFSKPRAAPGNC